jgi:hypothetical protein
VIVKFTVPLGALEEETSHFEAVLVTLMLVAAVVVARVGALGTHALSETSAAAEMAATTT